MDKDSESQSLTNEHVIKYTLTGSDNLSGIATVYITGEHIEAQTLVEGLENNVAKTGEIVIKNTAPQGSISVSVKLVDNAGNESIVATKSIVLDTDIGTPSIVLTKDGDQTIAANSYINYHEVYANVTLADTDIVGYKVWETVEPDSYTSYESGKAFSIKHPITLSANDGAKTVYAKLIDASGSATVPVSYTINIDTVIPEVALTAPKNDATETKTLISAVAGHNSVELTMKGIDAAAGVKSYILTVGETVLASGSEEEAPVSFVVDSSMLVEGDNTIKLTVVDKAENSASKEVVIELDKTAPTFDVPALDAWYNEKFSKQFSVVEKNTIKEVYAWTNTKTVDTEVPSGAISITAIGKNVTLGTEDIS
jgi:hypothetical protein